MKWTVFLGLILSILYFSSCAGTRTDLTGKPVRIRIDFRTESYINDGIKLPLDVIVTENSDSYLKIGPDKWFGKQERLNLLKDQLYKFSFKNGENKNILIDLKPGIEKIIIYAGYDNNKDRNGEGKKMVLFPERWHLHYCIEVKSDRIEQCKVENSTD